MQRNFRRLITPLLLAGLGIAAVLFGAQIHFVLVMREKEIQVTNRVPVNPPAGLFSGGLSGSSAWGDDSTSGESGAAKDSFFQGKPAFAVQKIVRVVQVPRTEYEPELLRELTVGGVTLRDGELRRTYRGEAPLLCRT